MEDAVVVFASKKLQRVLTGKSEPKYRNEKVHMDGLTFDSAKESRRYLELKLMERAGAIRGLAVHPVFDIIVNGQKVCNYVSDFDYVDCSTGKRVVEDTKGFDPKTGWDTRTPIYRLKCKLMKIVLGIEIHEI